MSNSLFGEGKRASKESKADFKTGPKRTEPSFSGNGLFHFVVAGSNLSFWEV